MAKITAAKVDKAVRAGLAAFSEKKKPITPEKKETPSLTPPTTRSDSASNALKRGDARINSRAKLRFTQDEIGTAAADYQDFSVRYAILMELGKEAQVRYNRNLLHGAGSYNLSKLKNSLQFVPDLKTFENDYYLEAKTEEWTKIAVYFEYGTGLFNTRSKGDYIKPVNFQFMRWQDKESGQMIYAKKTKGVKPVFAMQKAVLSVRNDKEILIRKIVKKLETQTLQQSE